ncbi:MAG: YafY family protein [Clostridia bacterium]|nr:YafY family protein [Clostridia bacterium]
MKLNRLFEITSILLNRRTVTAAELAERFGVSVRTIYRDIDVLSASGVPVYTTQGAGGGISLLEEYSVNRAMLSDEDRRSILFALQSLQATRYPQVEGVLEKLGGLFRGGASDWLAVDFTPWGSDPNASNRFEDVRNAILSRRVVEVEYVDSQNRRTTRQMEPLRLEFKQSAWYLWGWCRLRKEYRSFRMSRIKRVTITQEAFERDLREALRRREAERENVPTERFVLRFDGGALYRLYDEYDDQDIHDNGDGTYTVTLDVHEDDWIYNYVLGFGEYAELLEPEHARENLRKRTEAIARIYRDAEK